MIYIYYIVYESMEKCDEIVDLDNTEDATERARGPVGREAHATLRVALVRGGRRTARGEATAF